MPETQNRAGRSSFDLALNIVVGLSIAVLVAALVSNQIFPSKVPFAVIRGLQIAGWVGVALYLLMLGWANRENLADLARNRRTASGGNALLQVVLVLAILGFLDYLSTRHHWRYDLTSNKQYSLSEQSRKVLKDLPGDVQVTAFITPSNKQAADLLKEYTYATPKFKLEQIDPDRDRLKAQQVAQKYDLAKGGYLQLNVVVFDYKGHTTTINGSSEQDFTSGLLKVTRPTQKVVYFLQGHGEADPDGFAPNGMGQIKAALGKQNYRVDRLNLFNSATPEVPTDADVVVVAAPRQKVDPRELAALSRYVRRAGKVMVTLDPTAPPAVLGDWLSQYGVKPQGDVVIDPRLNLQGIAVVVGAVKDSYQFHTITQSFSNGNLPTFYPQAESLQVDAKPPTGVTVSPLIQTSDLSWGLTQPSVRTTPDPSKDLKGPLKIAVAITVDATGSASAAPGAPKPQGRVVVFGDSSFAENAPLAGMNIQGAIPNDQDMTLASINWLAEDDILVSIPPKENANRSVELLGNKASTLMYASLGTPLLLFVLGGFVWWRRR